jgi:flagellar assembly protein FliH
LTRIKGSNVQIGSSYVLSTEDPLKAEKTKLELMIKEAEDYRQRILNETKKQASDILKEAKDLAEQTQQECKKLIEDSKLQAESEAEAIREENSKIGYDDGYKKGYEDGTKSLEDKMYAMEVFTKSQYDIKHNIIKSSELDILDLILAISRKVCQKSLESDIDVLKKLTVEAIKQLKDKESIKIIVNPELAEKIYSISEDLKQEIPKLSSIKIIEDANVSPDGTVVETPLTRVDSRLKTQIDAIADNLMSEYYSMDKSDDEMIETETDDKLLKGSIDDVTEEEIAEVSKELKSQHVENLSDEELNGNGDV